MKIKEIIKYHRIKKRKYGLLEGNPFIISNLGKKLNEKSIEILELIKDNGILNIDEICDNTKMEVKYINAILNELVLKDLLIEMNNQVYSLNI